MKALQTRTTQVVVCLFHSDWILTSVQEEKSSQLDEIESLKKRIEDLTIENDTNYQRWREVKGQTFQLIIKLQHMELLYKAQDRIIQELRHRDEMAEEVRTRLYDDYNKLKEDFWCVSHFGLSFYFFEVSQMLYWYSE